MGKYRWQSQAAPRIWVAVDQPGCIMLVTPTGAYTISNVDTLKKALDDARRYVRAHLDGR